MDNKRLAYGAMLALTRQNVMPKPAPLSTAQASGTCVDRSIKAGETVVLTYNEVDSLYRLGDCPPVSMTAGYGYFVDEKNRMYDRYSDGSGRYYLRVRNGIDGDEIAERIQLYDYNSWSIGYECAAYCVGDGNEWHVITKDGDLSGPIYPEVQMWNHSWGYRNGVIALASPARSGSTGLKVYTYALDGTKKRELADISMSGAAVVCPTSYDAVAILGYLGLISGQVLLIGITNANYSTTYSPFEGYNTMYVGGGSATQYSSPCGADQAYMYAKCRLVEPPDPEIPGDTYKLLDEWIIVKAGYDSWQGAELVQHFYGEEPSLSNITVEGIGLYNVRNVETGITSDTILVNAASLAQAYAQDVPIVSSGAGIRENAGYLWISNMGVYRKTASGWSMAPTSVYPREAPWGKLGYALHDVRLGELGKAIVLFE